MFCKPQPCRPASICVLIALVLLIASFSARCAGTPSPTAQPTSTPLDANTWGSAIAISFGDSVNGRLVGADDRDYFRIRVEENLVYDLSVVPGTLTHPTVVLYASDMSKMMESSGHPDSGEVQFVWPGYPGDYYVTVEGGEGGGSYALSLVTFPDDHGNDISFASPIRVGRTIRGSKDYWRDYDYFRFSANAGQLYRVEVATSDQDSWDLKLYDADGEVLAYNFFSGDKGSIIWEATNSGDHYIKVVDSPGPVGRGSWEGEYTLTVAPMSRPPEDEHGNGVRSAAFMELGEPVDAGLEYAGDSDFFRFRTEKGSTYRMDVALGTLDRNSYKINLYGPDGGETKWSKYLKRSGNAWEAPAAGEYYVAVSASGSETGSYAFTVTPINDDHGEGPESATELTLGEPIRGNTDHLEDRDYFRFRADKGWFYRIEASAPLTRRGVRLLLLDPKGDEVSLWGKIWEAPETRDFNIALETPYSMGPYELTISQMPVPPADDHGNYRTTATAIVVAENVSGFLTYDGDVDHFRFTADADQPYRVQVKSRSMDYWSTELHDSNGRHLSRLLRVTTEDSTKWFTWKAPGRDVYYISVTAREQIGGYTLAVVPVTDDHGDSVTSATARAPGESVVGSIDYQGDIDYVRFRAEAGHIYRIEVLRDTLLSSNIKLYDSASQVLAEGWDMVNISCSDCGDDWAEHALKPITWEAPTSAHYYVAVEAGFDGLGSYELAIDRFTE